ncbi:hypothetical protein [Campylobacter concisus]|uniref:Uncharacterized protein n=1 Tax=Campylobacter concisus (strain 13826) TaxID=360104 RepID=A7ZG45_CAMC1|nr:hypothetical protein [Campylobacter concisus]EAT97668.2 hypothetical protein CCC13826_0307 [Campylobacter concisus 13826]
MLIPTNSDRPMFKRFHEFVIEQNNGNTGASEQTLYDVAYSLFYESHALKGERDRAFQSLGRINALFAKLEEQNEQLKAEIEQAKAKFEKLASNYVVLCDEIDELKSKLSLKEQK